MIYERKIMLRERPGYYGKELYIYTQRPDGTAVFESVAGNVITEKVVGRGEVLPDPIYVFNPEDLQLLADELQRLNIRPREASKTEGLYEAQSEHLKDLRTLLKLK